MIDVKRLEDFQSKMREVSPLLSRSVLYDKTELIWDLHKTDITFTKLVYP